MAFHETALISSGARIGENVAIGPFAVIGDAEIRDGVVIHSHVVVGDGVRVGEETEIFNGALIGREPKAAGAASKPITFTRRIEIGARCSIGPHAIIYYDVAVGDDTLIGDGASIREQCRIGSRCLISRYVTLNYNVAIGDGVKVMDMTHLTGDMALEDDVFVSCLVATTNDNRIRSGYGDHIAGPIVRKSGVVAGAATLLPGVEVGECAFVGAGAVVTKSVPAGETWVGMPAKARPASE